MSKPRIDLGRKGLRDPVIRHRFVTMVRNGVGMSTAARAVGVAHSTVARWLRDGEAAMVRAADTGGDLSDEGLFAVAVAEAIADMQSRMVGVVADAAADDWRAAAWLLERRTPADYGPKQVVAVESAGEADGRDVDSILSRLEIAASKVRGGKE